MRKVTLLVILTVFILHTYNYSIQRINSIIAGQEKRLVVIIPSYNNSTWYKRNLDSVFSQQYENYHVIYIDDCSSDDIYNLVHQYIEQHKQQHRVTLIKNQKRKKALANIYSAAHSCDDDDIIILLDGDDWFKHELVLKRINDAYTDAHAWMTYGQYEEYPSGKIGICKELNPGLIEKNVFREYNWVTSHLRTFYAGLFKKIKLKDFLYKGQFFPVAWDLAIMLPLLEMAREHCIFIPDIVYVYNLETSFNDSKKHAEQQIHCDKVIRSRAKYDYIESLQLQLHKDQQEYKATMLIFSSDKPLHLYALLESIQRYVVGIEKIDVIYRASNNAYNQAYETVKASFSAVQFIMQRTEAQFKSLVVRRIAHAASNHILLAHDGLIVKNIIDIPYYIDALEKTGAHAFYCSLGKNIVGHIGLDRQQNIPASVHIGNGMYAWQFKDGEHDWRKPYSCCMALYNKKNIIDSLLSLHYDTPYLLDTIWNKELFDMDNIGLYNEQSNVLILTDNVHEDEYLNLFNQGLKIDVRSLFALDNTSICIQYDPIFAPR